MSTRIALLHRAADNYRRAGDPRAAARCLADSGDHQSAASVLQDLGETEAAALEYRLAGNFAAAARCFAECGRSADAAAAWEGIGNPLFAGWALLRGAASAPQLRQAAPRAQALLTRAQPPQRAYRLLRAAGLALCAPDLTQASARLSQLVAVAVGEFPGLPPTDRRHAETWLVHATELLGRHDLGATIFVASYRAGTAGALQRWQQWADHRLGDRTGLPELSAGTVHRSG